MRTFSLPNEEGNGITEGVIWKQLLLFFFPILFGTFFQQLYNTADAVIVGRFVGKEALAAVGGSTSVLINLLVNLFVGISSGATVVVAQKYGARQFDQLRQTVHSSVLLAVVAGGVMSVLSIWAAPYALEMLGTPADVFDGALTYMRIYLLGLIASFLYNMGAGILRAVGDTRRPLYFLITSCLVNIVLDLLLVVGLGLGVLGVAIATLASQIISAILVVRALCQKDKVYHLERSELHLTPSALTAVLRVGLPAGLQADMYGISNTIIQSCINGFGTDTIAAWTAFGKIDGFFWMVMGAFGVSITTFVSQNFGAQRYDRIRKSVRVCVGMALAFSIFISGVFALFGGPLFHLFTNDTQVLEIGLSIMGMMVPYYFTYVFVEVLSGAIRGTGVSLVPMILTCCGICLLRVVWVLFVLPYNPTLSFLIVSYPLSWASTAVLFILYYVQGGWLRNRVRQLGLDPQAVLASQKA